MTDFIKPYVAVLDDVTFAFVKMAEAAPTYDKTGTEYTVDAIVSKATAKKMKKEFQKMSIKEVDNEEFEEKYKIAPPFPEQDEQYVLKFKKKASKGDEVFDPQYRPKVMLKQDDGSAVDITLSKLVANGSKGKIAYRVSENKFGIFAYLHSILVEDFVEYVPKGGASAAGSEFGVKVVGKEPENKAATEHRKSQEPVKQKQAALEDEELGSEIPF